MIALTDYIVGLNNPHLKHPPFPAYGPTYMHPSKPWFRLVLNMGEKIAFIPQLNVDGF